MYQQMRITLLRKNWYRSFSILKHKRKMYIIFATTAFPYYFIYLHQAIFEWRIMHRRDSALHLHINRNFCSVSRKITLPLTSKKIVISLPNIDIRYGNELLKSSLVQKICNNRFIYFWIWEVYHVTLHNSGNIRCSYISWTRLKGHSTQVHPECTQWTSRHWHQT